ncbi:hypothetical protein RI367_006521 [Sorochytrium milnesiophthora]
MTDHKRARAAATPTSAAAAPQQTTITIGSLLPLNSADASVRAIAEQSWAGIQVALKEVNAQSQQLQRTYNVSNYDPTAVDASSKVPGSVGAALALSGSPTVRAVIAEPTLSSLSVTAADLATYYSLPQCNFWPTLQTLGDKARFPIQFQTAPNVRQFAQTTIDLLQQQDWHNVGLIYSPDAEGLSCHEVLDEMMDARGRQDPTSNFRVWLLDVAPAQNNLDQAFREIGGDALDVLILAGSSVFQSAVVNYASRSALFSGRYNWLVVNGATDMLQLLPGSNSPVLSGVFMLQMGAEETPTLTAYKSAVQALTGSDNSNTTNVAQVAGFNAYSCMHLLAMGLDQYVIHNGPGAAATLSTGSWVAAAPPTLSMFSYDPTGQITPQGMVPGIPMINSTGMVRGQLVVFNYQDSPPGSYSAVQVYSGEAGKLERTSGTSISNASRLSQDDDDDVTVTTDTHIGKCVVAACSLGLLACLVAMFAIIRHRKTAIVMAMSPLFSCMILVGLMFLYVAPILQVLQDDGDPLYVRMANACQVLACGFVLGNVIAKNQRIWQLFDSPFLFKHGLPDKQILGIAVVLILIDVVFAGLLAALSEYTWSRVPLPNGQYAYEFIRQEDQVNRVRPVVAVMCVYNSLLVLYATLLAWQTRNVPVREYRDSRAIGLTVYNFVLCGSLVMLSWSLTENLYLIRFGLHLFGVWFCATFTFIAFFVPPLLNALSMRGRRNIEASLQTAAVAPVVGVGMGHAGLETSGMPEPVTPSQHLDVARSSVRDSHSALLRRSATSSTAIGAKVPAEVNDCYQGTLVVRRRHRLSTLLTAFGSSWSAWRPVRITLIPHSRTFTLQARSGDTGAYDKLSAFQYDAVLGPDDVARTLQAARSHQQSLRIIPTHDFYETGEAGARRPSPVMPAVAQNSFIVHALPYEFTFQCETPAEVDAWVALFKHPLQAEGLQAV